MSVRSGKSVKNQTKQLLLVLLFILVCIILSNQLNYSGKRRDSGVAFRNGVYEVPTSNNPIYFVNDLIFTRCSLVYGHGAEAADTGNAKACDEHYRQQKADQSSAKMICSCSVHFAFLSV